MQIAPELLSEKNYTGTRLILLKDEQIYALHKELTEIQKSINPILDELAKDYYPLTDPIRAKITEMQTQIKSLRDEANLITERYKDQIKALEDAEQRAGLIKNKLQPLVLAEVEPQLSEFESAKHTKVKGEQIYVEVYDEIEERVKAIRQNKEKK